MTRNDDFYDTYEAAQLRQQDKRRRERRAITRAYWPDDGDDDEDEDTDEDEYGRWRERR